jgi:hypothetical protein
MSELVYLIERIAIGLYLVCGVILLASVRRWWLAQSRLRAAEFELERELALKEQAGAVTWVIGMVEVILGVVAVALVVAPTVRADSLNAAGTANTAIDTQPGVFMTATPGGTGEDVENMFATVTAQAIAGVAGPSILLTPVPTATPVGTIIPDLGDPEGCDSDNAKLHIPANGQVIFDTVIVEGQAWAENFSAYKFEIAGPSTGGQYAPIGANQTTPVREQGVLGQVALAGIQPGDYKFRLVVFDNTATLTAYCSNNVRVTFRPPTVTPPGGAAPVNPAP